ncbi:MAG: undecaprenyldiphospho-muramoylpentapeptide beta-N-acetylglucosaminyltransferase [Planctomycetes bacterium]|nr:undecaprenyldiphospho-muramoylpentapeptide beta-N-acetylglucosaminyltransferase [Planctomycetota bacterium]
MSNPRIVIAGGGTGGHVAPALALAEEITARFGPGCVHLICGDNALERGMIANAGLPFTALSVARPKGTLRSKATTVVSTALAVPAARRVLKDFRASAVVCVGGYASLPGAMAAGLLRVPVVALEANAVPGRVTRTIARFARVCYAHLPLTTRLDCRVEVRGNPVRAAFRARVSKAEARRALGLDARTPVLLCIGGSQGAAALNDALLSAAPTLPRDRLQVLHLSGNEDAERAERTWRAAGILHRVAPFTHHTALWMAAADLALTRAGAGTISELMVMGVPMLLVPYPEAADDHQRANAAFVAAAGAGLAVPQESMDAPRLRELLETYLFAPENREKLARAAVLAARPKAAEDILRGVLAEIGFSQGATPADSTTRAAA